MVATRLSCAISHSISRYFRSRRVLSKAMVACAAKSLNKEICLSVNGCTCVRPRLIIPTISLSLSNDNEIVGIISLARTQVQRSEEHTSELQSPDHLVSRLLLEKKNTHQTPLPHPPAAL